LTRALGHAKKVQQKLHVANAIQRRNPSISLTQGMTHAEEAGGGSLGRIATSALGSIPLVGGLAQGIATEVLGTSGGMTREGGFRGGRSRGVQMIDASTGLNLGVISRKKALSVLIRKKRPFGPRKKQIIITRDGEHIHEVS
jgi:hypothetical protein